MSPGGFRPAFQATYVNIMKELAMKLMQPIAKSVPRYP